MYRIPQITTREVSESCGGRPTAMAMEVAAASSSSGVDSAPSTSVSSIRERLEGKLHLTSPSDDRPGTRIRGTVAERIAERKSTNSPGGFPPPNRPPPLATLKPTWNVSLEIPDRGGGRSPTSPPRLPSRPHSSTFSVSSPREDEPPPVPAHKVNGNRSNPSSPTQFRKPFPPKKPALAPKPTSLTLKKSANAPPPLPNSPKPPLIRVSSDEDGELSTPVEESTDEVREIGTPLPPPHLVKNGAGRSSVRDKARMFENISTSRRPISLVSTSSSEGGQYEAADSEDDECFPSEPQTPTANFEHDGRNRNSSFVYGDNTIHEGIIAELKRQGMVRDSTRSPHRSQHGSNAENGLKSIPPDVGKLRDESKKLQPPSPNTLRTTVKPTNLDELELADSGTDSFIDVSVRDSTISRTTTGSDRSSSSTGGDIPDYNTGDPEEDKRLKKLHYAAHEFLTFQANYVDYLTYTAYLGEWAKSQGVADMLGNVDNQVHPVIQIRNHFLQILPVHRILLEEISKRVQQWNSQQPNMTAALMQCADFIKVCKMFLVQKANLTEFLGRVREENEQFHRATLMFEQRVFKRGVGGVQQQLDQVHQNLMRYKLLSLNYSHYLVDDTEEKKKAEEAILKFDGITKSINESMGLPTSHELMELSEKLNYKFEVFKMGRRLIKQGEAKKQTRKELQSRYLILFNDYLLVCRIKSFQALEITRNGVIHTDHMEVAVEEHEDKERELAIIAREKSVRLVFETVRARNEWYEVLIATHKERREVERRKSSYRKHSTSQNSIHPEPQADEAPRMESTSAEPIEECCTEPGTPCHEGAKSVKDSQPLWIPDVSASRCLMDGCRTVFSMINRRHHCRNCGWLICGDCMGKAPLKKKDYEKENVCPECYLEIWELYKDHKLFPKHMIGTIDGLQKIMYGKRAKNLFKCPKNYSLKKQNLKALTSVETAGLVYGKVYMKTSKNTETQRHARLMDGMLLYVYKAEFDKDALEKHFLYGFELNESTASEGGTLFTLTHRNQHSTRNLLVIAFRVENDNSARKWSQALRDGLAVLPHDEETETNDDDTINSDD